MPSSPIGFCPRSGCSVRSNGPCQEHRKQAQRTYDDRRGSAKSRGYTDRWAWWRVQTITEHALMFCGDRPPAAPKTTDSRCSSQGLQRLGKELDHIAPISGPQDPRLYDESNVQLLCPSCHAVKRSRESRQ